MYIPLKGQASLDPARAQLDGLDLGGVNMNPYHDHRQNICLSWSVVTMDGSDTDLVGCDIFQSECCASLVVYKTSTDINVIVQVPKWP